MEKSRERPTAWVFTLGNEVVEGRIVNTNASYLGRRLTLLGFRVMGNISLIDDVIIISDYLRYVASRYRPKLIVTSGGLGPTYDDRTLEAVAKAFNINLVINEEALRMIKEKYAELNLPLTDERKKMAYLPEGSVPIPNPVGTAPGSWLEIESMDLIVVSLPGVPRELEAMWEGWVEKHLKELIPNVVIVEETFTVVGVPESSAATVLKEIYRRFSNVYVKTHPRGHEIRGPILNIYIMASSESRSEAESKVKEVKELLISKLKELGGSIR